jgi:hypothetical protein
MLYQLSYRPIMEEEEGFEPPRGLTRLSVFKTDPFSQTWVFLHFGAEDGDRTRDPHLGKVMFYH